MKTKQYHTPVMLQETLHLVPSHATRIIDGTLGDGGHSYELYKIMQKNKGQLLSFDVDQQAIHHVQNTYLDIEDDTWQMVQDSYHNVDKYATENSIDYILLDLGVSMRHLKDIKRGFTFNGKHLDMRMDQQQSLKASDVLNILPEKQLQKVFVDFGGISQTEAKKLANEIVRARNSMPFGDDSDVGRFNSIGKKVFGGPRVWQHKKAAIYQSLRIVVNNEFENIKEGLQAAWRSLKPDGILAVLSYHSGEHNITEEFMKSKQKNLASPQLPTEDEIARNHASRSAQLRWIAKK